MNTTATERAIEALRALLRSHTRFAGGVWDDARKALAAVDAEPPTGPLTEALRLIAAPMRPDGTWNRDREACQRLAADALAAVDAEPCACKDRPLSQCPGEWEPGCDLGRNETYVVPWRRNERR